MSRGCTAAALNNVVVASLLLDVTCVHDKLRFANSVAQRRQSLLLTTLTKLLKRRRGGNISAIHHFRCCLSLYSTLDESSSTQSGSRATVCQSELSCQVVQGALA